MSGFEELAIETVLFELPEKLRNKVKAGKYSTLEEEIRVGRRGSEREKSAGARGKEKRGSRRGNW